jgi:pimeloyl-ACP methyl ester carboxylesterase
MAAYARQWVPQVLSKAGAQNAALMAAVCRMVEDCRPDVHARQNLALLHRPDAQTYLKDLPFPVLLITGSQDHLSTEAVHAEIAQALPDAEQLVLPDGGHLLTFEQPLEIARAVDEWLDRRGLSAIPAPVRMTL